MDEGFHFTGQRALALESLAKTQARVAEIDGENWLHIGRAFLDLGQIEDSEACLERGKLFEGQSAEVFCMQARLDKVITRPPSHGQHMVGQTSSGTRLAHDDND